MTENYDNSVVYANIGVIGAGAWGTALAMAAAKAGRNVQLWAREPQIVDSVAHTRENVLYLPGVKIPQAITVTGDLAQAARADALLLVVPAQHLRAQLALLAPVIAPGTPLVLCAKGIERGTGKLLPEILREILPACVPAILSGPSFARDVAHDLPTAVTIAAEGDVAAKLQASLGHLTFRPYASDDVIGVALGGAAKNVYAIACGIVAGMGLGESARAALIARSFAELCRLGEALGAKRDTLMGLSGLGDLVLTATSASSRNYAFGLEFGQGVARAELLAPGRPLAEGVATAPALVARARDAGVEMPIGEAMTELLDGQLALNDAVPRLMGRPLTTEI